MRIFTHQHHDTETKEAGCIADGCTALADHTTTYAPRFNNPRADPPVISLALALPLCAEHGAAFVRALGGGTDFEMYRAGLLYELLYELTAALRTRSPIGLAVVAPVVRQWMAAYYPAQAAQAEAMLRGEDATAVRQVAQ